MSSIAIAQGRLARAREAGTRAAEWIEALPVKRVLVAFAVVDWLAVLATALVVRHAGWIYYQGGDQLWYYTLGWLIGHGQLTQTLVGYGWSMIIAPIALVAGPNLVSALPALVLLQVLVLLPVAMLCLYGIAAQVGGRLFGYWTLVLWVTLPFLGILYTNTGYHQRYTELTLPQAFGLTAMADFPALVATLVAVYFCARLVLAADASATQAAAFGVAAGVVIAIKPGDTLFLAGPALALAFSRRFAHLGIATAAILPSVVALAVWKERGLGHLPILTAASSRGGLAAAAPLASLHLGRYLHNLDWHAFTRELDLLREHFWSARLLEWMVVGGLIGLGRRSRPALLLIGGWLAAFIVVKGSYAAASIEDASLFRVMMPAFPAFVLTVASVPLLLPHAPAKLRPWTPAFNGPRRHVQYALIAAGLLVSAIVPLGAFAFAGRSGSNVPATMNATAMPIPTNIDIGLIAVRRDGRIDLRWHSQSALGGPVFYRIWRRSSDGLTCPEITGSRLCNVTMPEIGTTHRTSFSDRPKAGHWVYRVAVAANWLNNAAYGDPYLVSRPIAVTVP